MGVRAMRLLTQIKSSMLAKFSFEHLSQTVVPTNMVPEDLDENFWSDEEYPIPDGAKYDGFSVKKNLIA